MASRSWNNRPGRSSKDWISRSMRIAIYIRDRFTCSYCGRDLSDAPPFAMGLDHLKPRREMKVKLQSYANESFGLPAGRKHTHPVLTLGEQERLAEMTERSFHSPKNLVLACRRCNSSRQDRPWTEFATGGAVHRIRNNIRRKLNLDLAKAMISGKVQWADCPKES